MVAYNLFVGGTETAGLGNSANSRCALSTFFPFAATSKYFLRPTWKGVLSASSSFSSCRPLSTRSWKVGWVKVQISCWASQLSPKVARLCKRQGAERKNEQRSFTREVVTGIGIPLYPTHRATSCWTILKQIIYGHCWRR